MLFYYLKYFFEAYTWITYCNDRKQCIIVTARAILHTCGIIKIFLFYKKRVSFLCVVYKMLLCNILYIWVLKGCELERKSVKITVFDAFTHYHWPYRWALCFNGWCTLFIWNPYHYNVMLIVFFRAVKTINHIQTKSLCLHHLCLFTVHTCICLRKMVNINK